MIGMVECSKSFMRMFGWQQNVRGVCVCVSSAVMRTDVNVTGVCVCVGTVHSPSSLDSLFSVPPHRYSPTFNSAMLFARRVAQLCDRETLTMLVGMFSPLHLGCCRCCSLGVGPVHQQHFDRLCV